MVLNAQKAEQLAKPTHTAKAKKTNGHVREPILVVDDIPYDLDLPLLGNATVQDVRALVLSLGGRPIAFQAAYARLPKCSVNSAVFLSQTLYWSDKESTQEKGGWFYKSREEWANETALSLDEVDTARKKLRDCGVLEEQLRDVPARNYYRVNLDRLADLLLQTSSRKSPELAPGKAKGRLLGKSRASSGKTRKHYKEQETTQENTQESTAEITEQTHVTARALARPFASPNSSNEVVPDASDISEPIPAKSFAILIRRLKTEYEVEVKGKRTLGGLRALWYETEGSPAEREERCLEAIGEALNHGVEHNAGVFAVAVKILREEEIYTG
jgi:hypothetical protein